MLLIDKRRCTEEQDAWARVGYSLMAEPTFAQEHRKADDSQHWEQMGVGRGPYALLYAELVEVQEYWLHDHPP